MAWLHPQTTRIQRVLPPEPTTTALPADPFTVPLSLAAQEPARALRERPTDVVPPSAVQADGGAPRLLPVGRRGRGRARRPGGGTSPRPSPGCPLGARVRRLLLVVAGLLLVAGALTALPWPSLLLVVVGTWLLRSGSLAASAAGDRRRLRGRRWYDGVQFLVAAPWHLVRGVPGSLLLALWSAGLAAAAALVCYALAAGLTRHALRVRARPRRLAAARPGQLAGPRAAGPGGRPGLGRRAALAGGGAARPGRRHGHRVRRGVERHGLDAVRPGAVERDPLPGLPF